MNDNDMDNVIEIRDPDIDAEAIMRQIRDNIRQRRAQAEAQGLDYDALLEGGYATRFESNVYLDLRHASSTCSKMGVGLSLTGSPLPVFGALVQRLRAALHQVAIYYVNMLAAQQNRFNEHVVRSLMGLVKELEKGPTPNELHELRQEIARLQARLEQLEAEKNTAP